MKRMAKRTAKDWALRLAPLAAIAGDQVGYAIGFVLQGRLIDRVGVKRVFFCAVLLWSLATGAHGLATSAVGFMICRFILGITEAANYPACVKTTRLWFPASERAVASGIFNAGTNVGAMMTPMLLPRMIPRTPPMDVRKAASIRNCQRISRRRAPSHGQRWWC